MCGRFAQSIPLGKLNKINLYDEIMGEYNISYNIAPSQNALIVQIENGKRILKPVKWGLIPSWTKPGRPASGMINTRFESITEKPSFKNSYKKRRCIVPVTGFFEWKKDGKNKYPYFISCKNNDDEDFDPMFLCGIYDTWISSDGEPLETFSIITRDSLGRMKQIHDRMPLILDMEKTGLWLGNEYNHELHKNDISSFDSGSLVIYSVSDYVNSYSNNTPLCIAPSGD